MLPDNEEKKEKIRKMGRKKGRKRNTTHLYINK
jgi:hypothetical protein